MPTRLVPTCREFGAQETTEGYLAALYEVVGRHGISGFARLNSEICGSTGHDVWLRAAWQEGTLDSQVISATRKANSHADGQCTGGDCVPLDLDCLDLNEIA